MIIMIIINVVVGAIETGDHDDKPLAYGYKLDTTCFYLFAA